jgi:hypothetical protein
MFSEEERKSPHLSWCAAQEVSYFFTVNPQMGQQEE